MNKLKTIIGVAIGLLFFCTTNAQAARTDMVDVSNYNGLMTVDNFVDMRDNYGVKAVTTKISEGTNYQDWTAANNIQTAQQAGLYINAYHFARYQTVQQAKDEADFACQTAKADGLPVGAVLVADVEAEQQSGLSKSQNDANNQAFCDVVKLYGYRPDVYTMASWLGSKISSAGWIASYPYDSTGKNWYSTVHGWQFRSDQQFNGSYGSFDASQLYDDYYTGSQPVVNTINNVVKVQTFNSNPSVMLNSDGEAYDTSPLVNGSEWVSGGITADKQGRPMFAVGNNEYLPQRNTSMNKLLTINYTNGSGPNAVDSNGKQIKGSNTTFKGGTQWKTDDRLYNISGVGYCYKVAQNEYVSSKYQTGSRFDV